MRSDTTMAPSIIARMILRVQTGVFLTLAVLGSAAGAQTRFEPPKAIANPATYSTVEQCMAVGGRLSDSLGKTFYRDTAIFTVEELLRPVPPVIVNALRECSRFFDVATVPVAEWKLFANLLLMGGHESDARTLLARRLAAIPANAERDRARMLDSMVRFYLTEAKPPRLGAADTLIAMLASMPASAQPWTERINRDQVIFNVLRRIRDTVRLRQAAERIVALSETLTDADRQDPFFKDMAEGAIYFALDHLSYQQSLDSLRHGGALAFKRTKVANWRRVNKVQVDDLPFPLGFPAPTIAGLWFQAGGKPMSTPVTRPTRGKVALVVFLNYDCYQYKKCLDTYATLQRLHKRFPDVELNLVNDYTSGYFGPRLLTDTTAEAQMLADYWLGYHKLPAALAVEPTTFWRLPDLDRRRMNQMMSNAERYRNELGVQGGMGMAESFLVDRDGMIVEWFPQGMGPEIEPDVSLLIDILLAR